MGEVWMNKRSMYMVIISWVFIVSIFVLSGCGSKKVIRSGDVDLDDFIHLKGYFNSTVIDIDYENKLVEVLTVDSPRLDIIFEGDDEMMNFMIEKSHIGWLLPITFYCENSKWNESCKMNEFDTLFVAARKVKPKVIKKLND